MSLLFYFVWWVVVHLKVILYCMAFGLAILLVVWYFYRHIHLTLQEEMDYKERAEKINQDKKD